MFTKLSLAAGALVLAIALSPVAATAAPALPQTRIVEADAGSLAQPVHFRGCRFWRHECADRWGWRTRMFYRCLWGHGC
jgi:hypothetical protein